MCILNLLQFERTYFPFFLCLPSLDFKTLFLGQEVGMRFKALHNESNIIGCVAETISVETVVISHYH